MFNYRVSVFANFVTLLSYNLLILHYETLKLSVTIRLGLRLSLKLRLKVSLMIRLSTYLCMGYLSIPSKFFRRINMI